MGWFKAFVKIGSTEGIRETARAAYHSNFSLFYKKPLPANLQRMREEGLTLHHLVGCLDHCYTAT